LVTHKFKLEDRRGEIATLLAHVNDWNWNCAGIESRPINYQWTNAVCIRKRSIVIL